VCGVGRGLGVTLGVAVGVGVGLGVGDTEGVVVGVGVGPDCAQYLPPVLKSCASSLPPQTIICVPVQTAVGEYRPSGAFIVLVAVQLSKVGLYLPPVSK
jgi:hypothetical protein